MFLGIKLHKNAGSLEQAPNNLFEDQSSSELYSFNQGGNEITLKKREFYPGTFLHQGGESISFGYGSADEVELSDEFLLCRLNLQTRHLEITRDAYCTLPLFYYMTQEECLISDSLPWIVDQIHNPERNKEALRDLLFKPFIDGGTLFKGIKLLTWNRVLTWGGGRAEVKTLPLQEIKVIDKEEPIHFKAHLEQAFDNYWGKVDQGSVAFEVSGGIDSSTMPLYIASKYQPQMTLATMVFPGEFRNTQERKLDDLTSFTQSKLVEYDIDPKTDYPLARFFDKDFAPQVFYQYQEIYTEALSKLAKNLEQNGAKVVFTGIGGDELFENNVGPTDAPVKYPEYVTPKTRALINAKPREVVEGPMADSAFYAGQSRNKVYIDHDIWPISPLSDPSLHAYCQTLPIEFRDNKNILRAYHEAADFPSSIYHPVQNEHFGRFFDDSVKANYESVLSLVSKHSALTEYVDWQKALEAFTSARYNEEGGLLLFAIFRLVTAEVILQASRRPSSL